MSTIAAEQTISHPAKVDAAIRRVTWRLIPFLTVLYIINYLDRINIGFAALSMNKDLGLTATAFGLATTIFYVGYVACEIPSNLLMARYGARVWLSRIMITWGIASAATMLVRDTQSLYVIRFIVGVAEAGFVPGVLLYLTYWFPESHRARANGWVMMAQPFAMALGATASGFIVDRTHGIMGIDGWRWMFFLEGIPAIFLGIAAFFYLTDRPEQSAWLDEDERGVVQRMVQSNRVPEAKRGSLLAQVLEPKVVLLAISYFALVNTLNAVSTWGPTIVREVMQAYSLTQVGLVAAIAPMCTLVAMPLSVWSSDRTGERLWHLSGALMLAAVGWIVVIYSVEPVSRLLGLCATTSGGFSAMALFWTFPQRLISPEARPAGIGLISAVGLMGSALSPAVIGFLKDLTGSFAAGLFYATCLLFVSLFLVWTVVLMSRELERVPVEAK